MSHIFPNLNSEISKFYVSSFNENVSKKYHWVRTREKFKIKRQYYIEISRELRNSSRNNITITFYDLSFLLLLNTANFCTSKFIFFKFVERINMQRRVAYLNIKRAKSKLTLSCA